MKTHTKWIAVYTAVVVVLALGAGFGMDHGKTTGTAGSDNEIYWNPDPYFAVSYDADDYSMNMDDLDYLKRMDLGFPRIDKVLDSYEETIKLYANRYGFDWRLILAVMNQESRFRTQAVSHRGAFGLMQIMPVTGEEVSSELGMESIRLPEDNIAGGVYYLWRMHTMFNPVDSDESNNEEREFDRLRLALAAYNGGPTRIRDAQRLARYLNLDPYKWEIIRDILPMLSRRYSTLHSFVWENDRPTGGYFEGYNETLNYVDRTVEYYAYYRQMFE